MMMWSTLRAASLTQRFAIASAILTAAAVLLVTAASVWLVDRQHDTAVALMQQRETAVHARTVGSTLATLASRMGDVANSPILATGLVDSAGRETYLAPFLTSLRQVNGIKVQVLFTDFEGKPIAGNGLERFDAEQLAWLRARIDQGSEGAAIFERPEGAELVGTNLLRYSRTNTPEGALVYKIRMKDLRPVPSSELTWGGKAVATGGPGLEMPVDVPAEFGHLALKLKVDMSGLSAPLQTPWSQYSLIGGIAALLALVVFLLGSRLSLGLTQDLRKLEQFAGRLGEEGIGEARAELVGSSETVTLARSINRMLDHLHRQQAHLQREHERKDEFLAMLAHELRNPLAPISSAAQLLRVLYADVPRIKDTSDIISRQVTHMTHLVDDLLDVSRVTRGLVTINKTQVELGAVLREAVEQIMPVIKARGHHLTLDIVPQQMPVNGDRTRLIQVAANLLNNAAKYTPNGGQIVVSLQQQDGAAVLQVRDNGIGIGPDLLPVVFDLFTQAERTPDRAQGGLGLGLALVKKLVELHDGRVEARSGGQGQGSTFSICLPLLPVAAGVVTAAPAALVPAATGAMRILVVDDNVDAAATLSMLLEAAGHQVTVEHSAHAALATAAQGAFEVILLDIGLPDMSGHELAGALKQLPRCAGSALVAVSGYGQAQDRRMSQEAGFAAHLVKPVGAGELIETIGRVRPGREEQAMPPLTGSER
ncbi:MULTISPECIES: ATP-binding protein [unclassified Massilia]|uniref:hybrid sensor histidine kinase/response regulator n=1 Tax=unclassified Massilia TaxID=2609279 RepID=UPI00178048A0|nr:MULTISPECIES: ATP-binding protein [unclassified Massilia]MBD8533067.1 response regulator [Massilia sp. CFBP 13647]MBD8676427.1 response regulator [Massilia sp. CFBP 13721]